MFIAASITHTIWPDLLPTDCQESTRTAVVQEESQKTFLFCVPNGPMPLLRSSRKQANGRDAVAEDEDHFEPVVFPVNSVQVDETCLLK